MLIIDINKLTNNTIHMITKDLGCEIEYPSFKWGKYSPGYMKALTEEEYQKLIKTEEFKQEQKRLNEQQNREIDEYYNSLRQWLIDNEYLVQ